MTEHRPDPDELLQPVQQNETRARRGRLKIFFGPSAGAGKTHAMLTSARLVSAQGTVPDRLSDEADDVMVVDLTYSDRVIEGSPQNSVTAVPVERGTVIPVR